MSSQISRREFLKLLPLIPALKLRTLPTGDSPRAYFTGEKKANVLVLVFDTFSAYDISLFGYRRETTPNLARFAQRATVYHNHHAGGNYTTPGTASLLTGTYPWTHRAIRFNATTAKPFQTRNIFASLGEGGYYRIAYTHMPFVNTLLREFHESIELHKPIDDLALDDSLWLKGLLSNDFYIAFTGWYKAYVRNDGPPSSLFLSRFYKSLAQQRYREMEERYGELFPRGIPNFENIFYYFLEDSVSWIQNEIAALPQPYFAYFHLLPPHAPYLTRHEFIDVFDDGWKPPAKPEHVFNEGRDEKMLIHERRMYDEYIAYVDAEFGRLFYTLAQQGVLENTWLVLTSDHGEIFERGILSHGGQTLHEPLLRVPLLISAPGQKSQIDVLTPTSSVDLLPTLLHVTGQPVPDWAEGEALPPYRQTEINSDRSIFALQAKENPKYGPLREATAAIVKGDYKLTYYYGYYGVDPFVELFNLANDSEELNDLAQTKRGLAKDLLNELKAQVEKADEPYR